MTLLFLVQTSRGLGIEVRDHSSDGRPGIFVKDLTPKGAAALVSSACYPCPQYATFLESRN